QWFGANQWLQILVGFTLAVTTVIYLLRSLPSETQVERASTALVVAIGLFWLGNSRKLAHGNESVHQFMVCLCLLQGMRWLNSEHPRRGLYAGIAGVLASLTFGSGAACFAAFFMMIWLRRDSWRQFVQLLLLAAVGALALMADNHGNLGTSNMAIVVHIDQLL